MKLTTAAAIFFILGVIVGCTSESEDSSAASTRCEDATSYLAAASLTGYDYATAMTAVLAISLLRPGEEGEFASIESDFLNEMTDLLDDLGPPEDLATYHAELTDFGREVARGLDLISQGRSDEAGRVLFRLADNPDIGDSIPDWVFECGVYG